MKAPINVRWFTAKARFFWVVLFALLVGLPAGAAAQPQPLDHVVARHVLKTDDSAFDLSRLKTAEQQPFKKILAAGYGSAPVWVRLRVDPGLTAGRHTERLLLRVRPGYLDEVLLFDPASASQPTGITGDRHPLSWQAVPSSVFNLALAPSEDARDIWVRLKSDTSRTAHFEVVRENDLLLLDAKTMMWSAVYLGCLTIFGFWGCAQLFWRRDWLTITFLGFQVASLVYGAFVLGVVRLLVDGVDASKTTDQLTSLMVLVAVFMSLSFNTVLLREMLAPRWGLRAMVAGLCVYPVLLLLMLGGHVSTALQINMIVVLVAPVLAMAVAVASRGGIGGVVRAESPSARWFGLAYFLISMLLTMAAALPGLGLVEGTEITLHIVMLHGVATGFLMLAMLLYRIFRLLQQRELLAAEAAFGRRRVQQEQAFRHDRERLLAMLAHELKTPLSTIRMLLATLGLSTRAQVSAQAAVRDMNNVIERCLQVGQLDDGALQVNWQPVHLGELARNVVASCSAASRVQLTLVPDADPSDVPCVVSDPHLLEIVLRNLLDNALKYSPEGSVVTLALSDAGRGQVALAVGNDVGLAGKPDPEKVFSKYYRHGHAKRWTGSGLGLYLVHGLVGNLGGKMTYHDLGARVGFQVSLPREQERSCS